MFLARLCSFCVIVSGWASALPIAVPVLQWVYNDVLGNPDIFPPEVRKVLACRTGFPLRWRVVRLLKISPASIL